MTKAVGAATLILAILAFAVAAASLAAVPDMVRWALLICALGFTGATIRLHHIDVDL